LDWRKKLEGEKEGKVKNLWVVGLGLEWNLESSIFAQFN
jgi:hypothetical protein